jgi:hypothetical protein
MPGRLTQRDRDAYTDLRRRGIRQVEAMKIQGISRQTAARIERSPEFKQALAEYEPAIVPGKVTHELPEREMPLEVALKLLNGLRGVSDPQAIQAVLDTVKDVVPPEVVADARKELLGPPMAPDGADGFIQRPNAPDPEAEEERARYGDLDSSYPRQAIGENGLPRRTWSDADRKLGLVFEVHAVQAKRNAFQRPGGLHFWGS